jgi:hypothetical protein
VTDLKNRWSIGHNPMTGVTFGKWMQVLREVGFDVDAVYWHRVAFITIASLNNSVWAAADKMRFGKRIAQTEIKPPIFVLGHWRSGTTHLHNLFSNDPQFAYPNTYQVVNPFNFLTTEFVNTKVFKWLLPRTRPMDNVRLAFSEPQEDELGLCLACLRSLYLGISFPRLSQYYDKYLTFEDAEPESVEEFKQTIRWFVQKLSFKYNKPIVLKSPSHTARIKILLDVFPDAKFVHVHRDPYTVFRSAQKYYDTAAWYTYLQKPDRSTVDEGILKRYADLHDAYFEQRDLIPAGRFHEIAFDDLDRDPIGTLETIYNAIDLGDFEAVRPEMAKYVAGLKSYQKNKYADLPPQQKEQVRTRWHRSFEEWSYPT